jgi:transposase-like protein
MSIQLLTFLLQLIKSLGEKIKFLKQENSELKARLENYEKYSKKPTFDKPDNLDYQKLTIDELPLVVEHEVLDYKQLINEALDATGKLIKPVQRRKNSSIPPKHLKCPHCQAPSDYLYKNNGDSGQYQCKICLQLFNEKSRFDKDIILKCPHCADTLEKVKDRAGFDVYKCRSLACPYYQKRLRELSPEERLLFKKEKWRFKMHYIYRKFNLSLADLHIDKHINTTIELARIHSSPTVLGLILTYHINYGLSAEKTAALMYDVHQVKISGQTIRNYARSVASLVRGFTDNYPYELSDQFCGDETYIRVQGKWHYIYFFFDAVKKIILSHRVNPHRDTETAIKAFYDVLKRFDGNIPEDLNLIVDGNPIYKLAQAFFMQTGINFEVTQVIGLTNEDEVSREYRPLKQIIERLNRTFKGNYKPLGGYGSETGSIASVILFTTYFNFLRPHSSLEKKRVPVILPELESCEDMPQKWIRLLSMSEDFLASQQLAA